MTGPVTALGIRDGDPDVLRALIARRGSAVLAYCERACPAAQVADAVAEAFARFRALVVAAPRPADLDPEAALLSSTRHAAAERAPRGQAPPAGAGLGRLLGGRPTADQITLVPELLIARADGTLDAEGEEQLNRLLDASASARAAEERFRTAEHAYRSAPPRPIPEHTVEHIIAAMTAVPAPVADRDLVATPAAAAGAAVGGAGLSDAGAEPPRTHAAANGREAEAVAEAEAEPAVAEEPAAEEAAVAEGPAVEEPAAESLAEEPRAEEPLAEEEPVAQEPVPEEPVDEEPPADEHVDVREEPAVEEPAEVGDAPAAEVGDAPAAEEPAVEEGEDDPADATQEWDVPSEELGSEELGSEESLEDDEEFEDPEPAPPPPRRPGGAVSSTPSASPSRGVPGKGALAPAAAVAAVAAVSILATSGVLGGDESQPPVDTGIAPQRSQVEVPEGEAAAVIDDLRRAADDARRQRLADKRGSPAAALPPEEAPRDEAPAPEAQEPAPEEEPQEDTPVQPEAGAQDEEPAPDDTGGAGDGNAAGQATP